MTKLYITEPGSKVSVRGGALVVQKEEEVKGTWPLQQVSGIYCFGPVYITGHGMHRLLEARMEVHLFTSTGRYRGRLASGDGPGLFVQLAHYDRWRDGAFRLVMARGLVAAKVRHQRALLRYMARRHAQPVVRESELALGEVLEGLETAGSIQEVMGHEGLAARRYFDAFGELLREGVVFNGRSRQPPRDPPNALLSLGYTLLATELGGQLEAAGLHPRLSFLHGFRYGRASLSQDLIEEFRQPVIDRWVLNLFNTGRVQLQHFEEREGGGIYLTRDAFKAVLQMYNQQMGRWEDDESWRSRVARRVQALVDAVVDGRPLEAPAWGERY